MRTSETHPLQINEVRLPNGGVLGLTFAPGKQGNSVFGKPWHRDLATDLTAIKSWGADYVITLLEDFELDFLKIHSLPEQVEQLGMKWVHLPIVDVQIPDERFHKKWQHLAPGLYDTLAHAGKVLLHCRGGLGRTGLVAAQILVEHGVAPDIAINTVRISRPGTIETAAQEAYVRALPVVTAGGTISKKSRFIGCLLAGAVGDALGAPVEFMNRDAIVAAFGEGGIRDYVPAYGRKGAITDDTQMTLFTGEGLLRAKIRHVVRGLCHPPSVINHAYQRWLRTQEENSPVINNECEDFDDGWLMTHQALFARRAPGNTCLIALKSMRSFGDKADNNSKGCGGVMRVAPVGLFYCGDDAGESNFTKPFRTGAEAAAITHGHPTSTLSSASLASLIYLLAGGKNLSEALSIVKAELLKHDHHHETLIALLKAEQLANQDIPPAKAIPQIGEGWIAEEALAIAVYAVLASSSLEEAIVIAVNHSGDSDSTGSIAGNLAGTIYGAEAIPGRWLSDLELREVIQELASDLFSHDSWDVGCHGGSDCEWVNQKYPGW